MGVDVPPTHNRVWLVANVDHKTFKLKNARLLCGGPNRDSVEFVSATSRTRVVILDWMETPTLAGTLRMMKDQLKRSEWDWLRPILEVTLALSL